MSLVRSQNFPGFHGSVYCTQPCSRDVERIGENGGRRDPRMESLDSALVRPHEDPMVLRFNSRYEIGRSVHNFLHN